MAIRFQKRVTLIPGLRLNIGKTGLGLSAGRNGARVGLGSDGKIRGTLGLPGSGLSSTKVLFGSSRKASSGSGPIMTETGAPLPSLEDVPNVGIFSVIIPSVFFAVLGWNIMAWICLVLMGSLWIFSKLVRFAVKYPSLVGVKLDSGE